MRLLVWWMAVSLSWVLLGFSISSLGGGLSMPMMLCVSLYANYSRFFASIDTDYSRLKTKYLWFRLRLINALRLKLINSLRLRLINGFRLSYYVSWLFLSRLNILLVFSLLVHLGLHLIHFFRLLVTGHTRLDCVVCCRNIRWLLHSVHFSAVRLFRRVIHCSLSIDGWPLTNVL